MSFSREILILPMLQRSAGGSSPVIDTIPLSGSGYDIRQNESSILYVNIASFTGTSPSLDVDSFGVVGSDVGEADQDYAFGGMGTQSVVKGYKIIMTQCPARVKVKWQVLGSASPTATFSVVMVRY